MSEQRLSSLGSKRCSLFILISIYISIYYAQINSTKSMLGHLMGAAGAVEAVVTVQALNTGMLHPNLNLDDPEPEVCLNTIVGSKAEKWDINVALSNSFGFGGHNSCIMFKKFVQ